MHRKLTKQLSFSKKVKIGKDFHWIRIKRQSLTARVSQTRLNKSVYASPGTINWLTVRSRGFFIDVSRDNGNQTVGRVRLTRFERSNVTIRGGTQIVTLLNGRLINRDSKEFPRGLIISIPTLTTAGINRGAGVATRAPPPETRTTRKSSVPSRLNYEVRFVLILLRIRVQRLFPPRPSAIRVPRDRIPHDYLLSI